MRILTAVQCTGKMHLGNIVSTVIPSIDLSSNKNGDIYIFLADLHSFTTIKDPKELNDNIYYSAACWLSLGLDPKKIVFYRQSKIKGICELTWILNCVTPYPMLCNSHAFKNKSTKLSTVNCGLFDYPVLMASDILIMQGELIPVGKDQKQHIEITRDLATKFNNKFGKIFILPEAYIDKKIELIPGIDGQKMSKSYNNTIDIFGDKNVLYNKIKSIKTDSKSSTEPKDPENCIIFRIYRSIATDEEIHDLEKRYQSGTIDYKTAKELLYEKILYRFSEARKIFNEIKNDKVNIEKILQEGEQKAQKKANETMEKIKNILLI